MTLPRASILALFAAWLFAQQSAETTRQIWDTEFLDKRPPAPPAEKRRTAVRYRHATNSPVATTEGPALMVGVTLWRLRPPSDKGTRARLLVLEPGTDEPQELEPERIDPDTPLSEGDRVRLSVEAPVFGYLYVVDREIYQDDTVGDPYVIYPNRLTRAGDNVVGAGRVLEIPDQNAKPNCFTIRAQQSGLRGELLSVMIVPRPLEGITIGRDPVKLTRERYAEWEKQWSIAVQRLDLVGGLGEGWTEREKQAGAKHEALLTSTDAPPQCLYRVNAKPGNPVMLTVPLKVKR